MRLIDADKIIFDYSGLGRIPPNDGYAIAKYFADQIKAMPSITPQPNDPLTLTELLKMDGEPVWIVPMRGSGGFCTWMLVDAEYELCREAHGEMAVFENCGKTWLAYRRKPEDKNNEPDSSC